MASPARNIVLVGVMGSGKSSLAKAIARQTGCPRLDTDFEIEEKIGKSIPKIFAEDGEEFFRDLETEILKSWQSKNGWVISTGGGMVIKPLNRELLRDLGFIVWLHAPEKILLERVSKNQKRPLLQTDNPIDTMRQLITSREIFYKQIAQLDIDTSLFSRPAIINKILQFSGWK